MFELNAAADDAYARLGEAARCTFCVTTCPSAVHAAVSHCAIQLFCLTFWKMAWALLACAFFSKPWHPAALRPWRNYAEVRPCRSAGLPHTFPAGCRSKVVAPLGFVSPANQHSPSNSSTGEFEASWDRPGWVWQRSTHGQHTVNTRSTHGQHTVNTGQKCKVLIGKPIQNQHDAPAGVKKMFLY